MTLTLVTNKMTATAVIVQFYGMQFYHQLYFYSWILFMSQYCCDIFEWILYTPATLKAIKHSNMMNWCHYQHVELTNALLNAVASITKNDCKQITPPLCSLDKMNKPTITRC